MTLRKIKQIRTGIGVKLRIANLRCLVNWKVKVIKLLIEAEKQARKKDQKKEDNWVNSTIKINLCKTENVEVMNKKNYEQFFHDNPPWIDLSIDFYVGPVNWCCRTHKLHHCRGVRLLRQGPVGCGCRIHRLHLC